MCRLWLQLAGLLGVFDRKRGRERQRGAERDREGRRETERGGEIQTTETATDKC